MSQNNKQQQAKKKQQQGQQRAMGGIVEEEELVPSLLDVSLIFCIVYPPLLCLVYLTGLWDNTIVGGNFVSGLRGGSVSAILDVVAFTVCTICPFLGIGLWTIAKKYVAKGIKD
jgi:hypothetical protein